MPRSGDRIREKQTEDRKRKKEVSPEKEVSSGSDDGWKELDEELNNLGQSSPKHDGAGSSSFTASELAGKLDEGRLQWQQIMKDHRSGIISTGISSREKMVSDEKKKTDTTSTKTAEEEKQDNIIKKIKEFRIEDFKALNIMFSCLKNKYKKEKNDKYYSYNAIYQSTKALRDCNIKKCTDYNSDLLQHIKDLYYTFPNIKVTEEDFQEKSRSTLKNQINTFLKHFKPIIDENTQ